MCDPVRGRTLEPVKRGKINSSSGEGSTSSLIVGRTSPNDSTWVDSRRLSEAGIRRTSDNSVILTEDTDSFIIGERVWVGGIKPGQIAFIGETQFAPGEWAGIVLDDPIGKNDGSVSGTRYFQCESKRGVFSRLGRLTRFPLLSQTTSPIQASTPLSKTPPPSMIKSPSSPSAPSLKTPALPTGQTNVAGKDVKVGERVIVMSREGSKAGILRYKGLTGFAAGQWCGVELDDPLGKNDGSVNGVRYFTCEQKYGLFAPVHKVSRSPATGRRPSCQLHHHFGSKESLNSAASINTNSSAKKLFPRSFTSPLGFSKSSNQATIKEKEEEIGQLLRERELERSRMTKAAEQADEAEKKLKLLQLHFESFRQETEKKIETLHSCIRKLEEEKRDILSQLEDVQFRAEEETIIKSDMEVLNNCNLKRITELESLLLDEKSRCENLQQSVNKLEESEKTVEFLKTQIESLKKSEELLKFSQDNADEKIKIEITKLHNLKDDLSISLEEKNKDILNLNDKISSMSMKLIEKEQEIQNYLTNLNIKSEELENLELKCKHLNEDSAKLVLENELLKNKNSEDQKIYDETLKVNENLKKEMESYKEITTGNLAELNEKYSIAVEKFNNCSKQLTSTEEALKLANLNNEECERNVLKLTKEIEELQVNMNENISSLKVNNEKELGSMNDKLNSLENELDFYKKYSFTLLENMKKKIVEVDAFLAAIIERKKENLNTEMLTSLKTKVTNIISEIETQEKKIQNSNDGREVKETIVSLLNETISLRDHEKDCQIQLELHALEIEELKQKLQKAEGSYNELLQIKDKLENEVSELTSKNNDYSDRLTDLNERLVGNQNQMEQLSNNKTEGLKTFEGREQVLLEQVNDCNREIEELKKKLQITEEYNFTSNVVKEKLENGIEELKVKNSDYYNQLSNLNEELTSKQNQIDELNSSKAELIRNLEDKESQLLIGKEELKQEQEEFLQKLQSSVEKYNKLFAHKEQLENEVVELTQRNQEYNNSVSDLNERLNNYQKQIEELNKCIFDNTKMFEAKQQNLLKEVQDLNEMKLKVQKDYEQQCQLTNVHINTIEKYKTDIEHLNTQLLKEKERSNEYTALQSILNEKFINFERHCNENIGNYNVKIPVEDKTNELNIKERISEINANDEINLLTKENNKLKLFSAVSHVMSLQKDVANLKSMIKEVSLSKGFSAEIEKEFNIKLDEICFKLETLLEKPDSKAQFIDDENLVQTDQLNANVIKNNLVMKQSVVLDETSENILKKNTFENDMKFNKLKANVRDFSNAIKDQIINLENRDKSIKNIKFNYECNFRSMQQLIEEFVQLKKEIQEVHGKKAKVNYELNSKNELPEGKNCNCVKNGSTSNKVGNKVDKSSNSHQLANWLEEKELAESQINFLNSIIVDLQNKNTNLLSRINVLEKEEAIDKETKTKTKVRQAPRSFCDICDIFDAHETEDCPKQGNEDDSPPPTPKDPETRKQITRPYCEVCEVFGHDTQDCDDGQTF